MVVVRKVKWSSVQRIQGDSHRGDASTLDRVTNGK